MQNFLLLSLGSNLGNRKANILKATEMLEDSNIIFDNILSSFYETEPVGITDQPWFLNAALAGYTNLPLNNIIQFCKTIEHYMGRKPRKRWHEREIDIDILLYGCELVSTNPLTVPHPQMHKRRFVLKPAAEIAADAMHPGFKRTVSQLLDDCPDHSIVNSI